MDEYKDQFDFEYPIPAKNNRKIIWSIFYCTLIVLIMLLGIGYVLELI